MAITIPHLHSAHTDNEGSREQDKFGPDFASQDGTIPVSSSFNPDDQKRLAEKRLEANKGKEGLINWLGSSYSGVDIKVIVHLYGSTSEGTSPREDTILNRIAFNEALQMGADNLSSQIDILGGSFVDFDARRKAFDDATGLIEGNTPDQQALQQLRNQILNTGDFISFLGKSKIRNTLKRISETAKRTFESDRNELERTEKIRDQSSTTFPLGTLQTISIQSHREKFGVRALGHSYVKGYTRGPRTIAGSMIFTLFSEHPLKKLLFAMGNEGIWKDPQISTLIPDQIPPIDVTVIFANEYGSLSRMTIYGLEFLNDGVTFSIDDLLTEQIMNFVARDVDVMTKAGQVRLSKLQRGMEDNRDDSATSLLFGNDNYEAYLDSLKVRRSLVNR